MGKLIRMDLYRMLRGRSFLVCLALTFLLGLGSAPFASLMLNLARSLSSEVTEVMDAEVKLSSFFSDPFPILGLMLMMLSLCWFFYADVENGYIKNIAGQMPLKGCTVLSKFAASVVHNVIFAVVGIVGNVIGTLLVQRVVADSGILDSLRVLALKLLLIQSLTALLLLVVTTFQSKSLGMILAVLFGLGLTPLIYLGINQGLDQIFGSGKVDISEYMPDTVMNEKPLDTLKALAVALVAGTVFLLPAVRIFDKKDVK